jgi:hypothetical protein
MVAGFISIPQIKVVSESVPNTDFVSCEKIAAWPAIIRTVAKVIMNWAVLPIKRLLVFMTLSFG